MTGRNAQAGFTLIELLIALTLASVVLVTVTTGLYGGRRALTSVSQEMEREDETAVLLYLINLLREADNYSRASGRLPFEGDGTEIRFDSGFTSQSQLPGLYGYRLAYSLPEKQLVLFQSAIGTGKSRPLSGIVLLRGVHAFALRYFGKSTQAQSSAWSSAWHEADKLPEAVEITLDASGSHHSLVIPIVSRSTP